MLTHYYNLKLLLFWKNAVNFDFLRILGDVDLGIFANKQLQKLKKSNSYKFNSTIEE